MKKICNNKLFFTVLILLCLICIPNIKVNAASDVASLTCTYNNENEGKLIVAFNTNTNPQLYKNSMLSSNEIIEDDYHSLGGLGSTTKVKGDKITCAKYLHVVERDTYGNGTITYVYIDSNDSNPTGVQFDGAKNITTYSGGTFNPVSYVEGQCKYGSNITLSISETGTITLYDKSNVTIDDSGSVDLKKTKIKNEDYTQKVLLLSVCPNSLIIYKNKAYFGESFESIINDNNLDESKIDKKENLSSTSFSVSRDELVQEAEEIKSELNELNNKRAELQQQYNDNDCDNNKQTTICTDIYNQLNEIDQQFKSYDDTIENNQFLANDSEIANLISEFNVTATNFNFTKYCTGNECNLTCADLDFIIEFLKDVLSIIRIAAVVLFIVLGVTDYLQAIISGDQDLIKKANGSFIKRGIAFVILFLLPLILNLILKIAGISTDPTCGLF